MESGYQTLGKWSFGGPLSELYLSTCGQSKMAAVSRHSFNIGPFGKSNEKSHLKLHCQLGPNFGEKVLWQPPLRMYPLDLRSIQDDSHQPK